MTAHICHLAIAIIAQVSANITSSTHVSVTIVSSEGAKIVPRRVRYAWRNFPCNPKEGPFKCAVYAKKEMLPAHPFIMNVVTEKES